MPIHTTTPLTSSLEYEKFYHINQEGQIIYDITLMNKNFNFQSDVRKDATYKQMLMKSKIDGEKRMTEEMRTPVITPEYYLNDENWNRPDYYNPGVKGFTIWHFRR